MAAPSSTITNATGNLLSSQSLAGGANVTYDFDISAKYKADIGVGSLPGGTVAATSGLQIDVFRRLGSTPIVDTASIYSVVIPSVASTQGRKSFTLETGRYRVKLTNLDATNAVTVDSTDDTLDSVA